MQGYIENWFTTNVLHIDASSLIEPVKQIFLETDFSKFIDCRYPNGSTSFFSTPTDDFFKHQQSRVFVDTVTDATRQLASLQGVDMTEYCAVVKEIWMTQMGQGASHPKHVHPNSHFSGTFYLTSPEGCAPIRFYSPLELLWSFCPLPTSDDSNPITSRYVDHQPHPGKLLIWNSWLAHEVLPNNTESPRESVSFNIKLERIIK